jgi:S-adenosyl methyltransferase
VGTRLASLNNSPFISIRNEEFRESLSAPVLVRNRLPGKYAPAGAVRPTRFFEGTDLVEPGLVRVEEWRPEPGTDWANKSFVWCAVGRKR